MDHQREVVLSTKRVNSNISSLRSSLTKKNTRLVKKHVTQLEESLEEMLQVRVSAEMADVSTEEPWMEEGKQVDEAGKTILLEGEEYLLEIEDEAASSATRRVNKAKINELVSSLSSFKDSLEVDAHEAVKDVEKSQQVSILRTIVAQKRDQMTSYQKQKIALMGEIDSDQAGIQELEELYKDASLSLDSWCQKAAKHMGEKSETVTSIEATSSTKSSTKSPGLKLDRLALPVFRGNIRHFARFTREFENTVGHEFSDSKIKLMYLQNQCLEGPPKELVRNLTSFDQAMSRLKERYGNVSSIVDTVLRDIGELRVNTDDSRAIIALSRYLEKAWDDMDAIGSTDEFCNVMTLRTVESKLTQRLQLLWAQEKNDKGYGTSKEAMIGLRCFTDRHRKIAEEVIAMGGKKAQNDNTIRDKTTPYVRGNGASTNSRNVNAVDMPKIKSRGCFRCGFNHLVKDCRVPSSIDCRRCGEIGHIENACRKPKPEEKRKTNPDLPPNNHTDVKNSSTRLPIEQVNTDYGACLLLWNSGSAINIVDERWAMERNISGETCQLKYKVVDGSVKAAETKCFRIGLLNRDGEVKVIRAYGLKSLATCAAALDQQTLDIIQDQLLVDISEIDQSTGNIQLLIGSSCAGIFPKVVMKHGDLCLMRSNYGLKEYFVAGSQECTDGTHFGSVCNVEYIRVTPAHDLCSSIVAQVNEMKDFLNVEELGIRPPPICKTCKNCTICKPASQFLSLKDYRELNVIKAKLSYDERAKSWTANYPFLKDPSILEDNFESALKVLRRRENKLIKDENLKKMYSDQVKDFINRGVIRKMSTSELENWKGPVRYVDHREVHKEGATTPLRLVINSSFRDGNELSFNDILMKGPNVLTNLLEILIRWRLFPVAFVGDVSKMYHKVKTGRVEGNLRRLLWRDCEQDRPPDVYCFETVTFGDRPAGCIVVSALKATAKMFSFISEQAADVIDKDTYMDDVVSGETSIETAKQVTSRIEEITEKGGFSFKKFIYSGEGEGQTERVLGVNWKPYEDTLSVRIELNHNKRQRGKRDEPAQVESIPYTRRVCLRLVNGIFDPLGIFSPVSVRLKILMKQHFVSSEKYKKWDKLLEPEDSVEWIKVLRDVMKLKDLSVPRYAGLCESCNLVFICFSDASQLAMCAAAYIRCETTSGVVNVSLLASKTKVSPNKPETMPRLELCAALLGARLSCKIVSASSLGPDTKKYFFVDSKITLGNLNKGNLANDFNGNCVAEIRGKTEGTTYAWVSSTDNIADLGSRGTKPEMVNNESDWQRGPSWMYDPIEQWPIEVCILEDLPCVDNIETVSSVDINIDKFSCLHKLHKVTAICLKFLNSRGNGKKALDNNWKKIKLSPEDYKRAEKYWIKNVSQSVGKQYQSGKLQSLRPATVWDEDGKFLKVVTSGRLGKLLKIGYDVEELTILDPNHAYTRLVLKECHEQDHCGDDRTVWRSRHKFWIPQARREVKKIRRKCYRCRLLTRIKANQMMSPLPNQRVLPTPAWYHTSVDLFGPIEHVDMVRKRLKEKCWGILFTCMVTRAIHLDLTQSYDTDAVLQAIRRFMALRGAPKEFLSDQGSQLIACSKEVSGMLELIDWSFIEGWCSKREVKWNFVPPQGQHMNGVAESLVKITKNLLKQSLEGKRLTFVETQTVLQEVGQIINSRPLGIYSKPSSDPLDGGPITPNHLLLGRATAAIPDLNYERVTNMKRIKFCALIAEEFWEKWRISAFHSLVPQFKWHKSQRNLQVGDVVLLNEESAVGEYKLGQVEESKISKDGHVRSVKVRVVNRSGNNVTFGFLDRPIHKLCVIVPVEEQLTTPEGGSV